MSNSRSTAQRATAYTVDVALMPGLVPSAASALRRTVSLVVDVIRATTTLCVQFERGCPRVLVAASIPAARAASDLASTDPSESRPLLAGEVGGVAAPGFDYGNSPAEFGALDLTGHSIIFATTNGTRALHVAAGSAHVLVGSMRNCAAVARLALILAAQLGPPDHTSLSDQRDTAQTGQPAMEASEAPLAAELTNAGDAPSIMIVCSGRGDRPAYDDTICAGYLVAAVQREAGASGYALALEEGARIALAVADSARRTGLRTSLAESEAGQAVAAIGLLPDLDWCAAIDATSVVPVGRAGPSDDGLLVVEPWIGPI